MSTDALKILGMIGVRSGSKGLPHKNIRPLAGKPLMAWIIEAACRACTVNRVIVSTDSPEYAAIARQYGAEVPFLRPAELAGDASTDIEFIRHALAWLDENEGYQPDLVLRLLATVPMQQPEDMDAAVEVLLNDPEAHSAVVIAEARQHPYKALKLVDDGKGGHYLTTYITGSARDVTPIARQNYTKAYFRANVIVSRASTIRDFSSLTGDRVRYHLIGQERAIDIDSPLDFFIVEKIMEYLGMTTSGVEQRQF